MEKIQIVSLQIVKDKSLMIEYAGNIGSPNLAYEVIKKLICDRDREYFVVVCLDTKNIVTCAEVSSIGSLNSTIVHPREVFKTAILTNAASIIIGHNHPSAGILSPSQQDIEVSKRIYNAGKIIGIELLDHIIVNYDMQYISLKEKGYM